MELRHRFASGISLIPKIRPMDAGLAHPKLACLKRLLLAAKIANSLNSRPLGVLSDTVVTEDPLPVTPNMLLLGRSGNALVSLKHEDNDDLPSRLKYVQNVHQAWWNLWTEKVMPSLLTAGKWQKKRENIKEGDICMLVHKGRIKDQYRLVRVKEVHPSSDGLVRTVTVTYKKRNSTGIRGKQMATEKVPIQRLALLQSVNLEDSK